MAITMKIYGLTWTDADGTAQASSIGYDMPSAKDRKKRLEAEGSKEVEIVEVKPGERLQPKS
ncbi:hypothetical protein ABZT23_19345 [Streptomyces sp. NPDC005386]|uniref:hypothetical protein n=1 Tax=unclassified Streptomyces TaxID=2593676 RepID=UPI0033AC8165